MSRGAAHVTFVERDRRAQALIEENLARCGIADGYVMMRASVSRALADLQSASFDIMIFDPPYEQEPDEILAAAADRLAAGGVLVLEHARRAQAPESAGRLVRTREVISGDSALSLYSWAL